MPSPADPTHGGEPAPAVTPHWQVRLLGALVARSADQTIERFPSRAVAALLARLALAPERAHAREELVELLWPGVALDVGRNRLRQALSTLKSLLEPAGMQGASVLQADRQSVRVVPGTLGCDARDFERLARAGRAAQALALYQGDLMPGHYDDWVDAERQRLADWQQRLLALPVAPLSSLQPLSLHETVQRATPPPPTSAAPLPDLARSTLPHYLTRCFGADPQASALRTQVLAHRLVTLVGPGGSGKTRLAVELAQRLALGLVRPAASVGGPVPGSVGGPVAGPRAGPGAEPGDGFGAGAGFDLVVFVPLVDCHHHAQVLHTLLAALHVRAGTDDAFQRLVQALADRRVLLVLDNFEQLGADTPPLVARLAASLPGLHLLVTSRRVLGLDGEREFHVSALALPDAVVGAGASASASAAAAAASAADDGLDTAATNPAVALFVDRARAVRTDFHLHKGNLPAVVALVQALEGMPLAIELAAARVRSFSPAQMLARLTQADAGTGTPALDLLARRGPRAGHDARHASMQAVIAWSWQQLNPPQAALLSALTVFAGGCTAQAAEDVCGDGVHDTALLLDALQAQSMLRLRELADGSVRITLAEPMREFAAGQLSRPRGRRLRARHRAWWPRWAAGFGPTPPLAQVRRDLPNIVAALASAVADSAPDDAVHVALALRPAFNEIALPAGGIDHLAAALEGVTDPALQSSGHTLLGQLCFEVGASAAARQHTERGLALAGDDPALRARALHAAASVRWRAARNTTGLAQQLDEAAALAERSGEQSVRASVDALRAFIANVAERDFARGEALHRRALEHWQQSGNQHVINGGIYNLAICAFNGRRWAEALDRVVGVIATARAHEDWEQLSDALNLQGNTLAALRDWPAAHAAYRDCVRVAWGTMETHALAYGLWNLPTALAHLRQPEAAARLMSFAVHFWQRRFGPLAASDQPHLRRVRRLVTVQTGAARHDALWAEGAGLPLAQAVALALDDLARPT